MAEQIEFIPGMLEFNKQLDKAIAALTALQEVEKALNIKFFG